MKAKTAKSDVVTVRVPETRPPFVYVPGSGWHISVLWNFGADVEVSWSELRELLKSSKGEVVIARRLVAAEVKLLEEYRMLDHEVHARVIRKDEMRWQWPRATSGGRKRITQLSRSPRRR